MRGMLCILLGLVIGLSGGPVIAQRVKMELSKDRVAEADYYLENGILLSTLIKVKFSVKVLDLPKGSSMAYLSDIPEVLPGLRDKLQSILGNWGTFQLRKMIPNAMWGDTLVEQAATHKWVSVPDFSQCFEIRFPSLVPIDSVIRELKRLPEVLYAEPPAIAIIYASPNDPYYQQGQWNLAHIQAPAAWDITKGGQNISLGMVECGVNLNHEDLAGKVIGGDGKPMILVDHGTGVSGIAAASTNNGIGVASLGWNLRLRTYSYEYATFAACIHNAADSNTAINMSFGITKHALPDNMPDGCENQAQYALVRNNDPFVRDAIVYADGLDRVMVAAFGNRSPNYEAIQDGKLDAECDPCPIPFLSYPANYPHVIGVTATWLNTGDEQFYDEYNYGDNVDVGAPGVNIDVLAWSGYTTVSGSSCSAPLVTALAGLIRSLNPNLSATQVADIIFSNTDKIDTRPGHEYYGTPSWNMYLGYGRINAYKALSKVVEDLASQNKSSLPTVTSGNSQRKLCRESSGKLHEVFESGNEIFYRNSSDGGSTWQVTARLSTGSGGAVSPCITKAGSNSLVIWQKWTGSAYDVQFVRSTDGGSSWTTPSTLATVAAASPGPLPSISGASTSAVFVACASNNGVLCWKSTNGGLAWDTLPTLPGSTTTFNSPTTGIYRYSTWHYVSQAQIAYATDTLGGSPYIYHNYYDYDAGAFGASPTNVCSIVPNYTVLHHANPSLAVSADDGCLTVHVAWDALDPDYPPAGRVILYRKKPAGYGSFENQYTAIRYQGLERPSITGLSSDNAYMVYQNFGGSSSLWKAKYSFTGGSWGWGCPSWVGTGSNPQISSGSTSAKYIWTSGTSSPYQINVSNETLSKSSGEVEWVYRRALNVIDTSSGAFASLELGRMRIHKQDGLIYEIGLQTTPSEITQISLVNLVEFGTSNPVRGLAAGDSIELIYAWYGKDVEQILRPDSGCIVMNLVVGEAAVSIVPIVKERPTDFTSSQQAVRMLLPVQGLLPRELISSTIRLAPMVSGLRPQRSLIASVGHIYEAAGNSLLARELSGGTQSTTVPSTVELLSNYPNPFNPSTTIRYGLTGKSVVQLVVYNMLGEQVAMLFDGEQEQGYHEVRFDGAGLSSGVYFYRLKTGNFMQTKKLLLLR